MSWKKASGLAQYVEEVVYDLAVELDPEDQIWPDPASLKPLKADLTMVIEGAVADWEHLRRRERGVPGW